jgi:hypothetical protein
MDNETLASLLRGRNRAGQPVDATANIIGPAMSALGNTIYGAGRGALTAMAGLPGDINQLITDNLGTLVNAQGLPTTQEIQDFLPAKPTTYEGKLAQKLGEFVPVNPTPIAKGAVAIAKPVGKAMGEQAYRMTEDMLQKQGMMPSIVAYHGTPHNIEGAFDISKVGTGEGAQAYGHGMYYAENPEVADVYAKMFSKTPASTTQLTKLRDAAPIDSAERKHYDKLIEQSGVGNLYKVDVPDEYIPKMLDFDNPINKQPKEFVELLKDVSKNENFDPFEHLAIAQTIGKHPRNAPNYKPTGEELINNVSDILGIDRNSAEFSKIMKEYGIKGIKYADEGSRNWRILPPDESVSGKWTVGKWPGGGKETKYFDNEKDAKEYLKQNYTSNFVVFDPKEVKILEKNSKPVSRKDIIEKQINKLEPTITVQDRTIPVTLHPVEARQGNKIEYVNTDKFENAFKKDETGYIGKGGTENAIGKRYQGVEEFLKTAPSMRASEVHVRPNGSVVFGDGRHRYAFLRDQGLDKIPISMDADSIKNAKKFGYID